jgi:predicted ATP-binding protein involved in virulence
MTTHSPFVLQDVSRDSVLILNNGQLRRPEATLGQDINTILTQTMKTKTEENESSMQEIFELIALNDIETAKEKILAFESSKLFEGKLLRLEGAKTVIKRKEILAQ